MKSKTEFKHEALLDASDIQDLLKSISKGLGKGKLEFSDDKGTLALEPQGLLYLKVSASEEDDRQQVDIKIRWEKHPKKLSKELPKIGS
ncbi:amphi-Trp domain-containing protein [Marinomonas transparens]|uniref:Amphi-Trp domain-containing protein n=1 Tax=Marinomonas transparens TaxID=2795388 RepID=A0A934JX52_9GAMM|nr:amphi-Trp domain-containing protein [Marinomonas transparens]MBJ7538587.1 amphi-Trp domain-containing protein [Marinomonas transparens]